MHAFLKIILLIGSCFLLQHAKAQVKLTAVVAPQVVGKDEYFTYKIIIENPAGVKHITAPLLKNFVLLNGPIQGYGRSIVNGNKRTDYISVEYMLKPKRLGKFIIGPAKVQIGNSLTSSNSVSIIVNNTSGNAANLSANLPGFDPFFQPAPVPHYNDYIFHKGDKLADKIKKNVQLRIEVDKKSCYVGEPVVAIYKLYSRLKEDISDIQNPSFNGFSVVDMQPADLSNFETEKLDGKEYNVYILRKAQLYPLQAGIINIDSAEVEANVHFINEDYTKQVKDSAALYDDFLNSALPPGALINETVSFKSTPVNITVKPLPEKNKPVSFYGAVGNYEIAAALQHPLTSTDETGILRITVTGNGNMQLLTSPDVTWPAHIEYFDPMLTDNLSRITVPVSGSKIFDYSFTANDSGNFIIPSIVLSYFDPVAATYKTLTTSPVSFHVNKGNGHPVNATAVSADIEKPSFLNNIFNHRLWIIIFIGTLIFTGLFMWIIREKIPVPEPSLAPAKELEEVKASNAETLPVKDQPVFSKTAACLTIDDCLTFYPLLYTELKTFLAGTLSVDVNGINADTIVMLSHDHPIPPELMLKLKDLMQTIEWQLYTPFEKNESIDKLYNEANDIVRLIKEAAPKHL